MMRDVKDQVRVRKKSVPAKLIRQSPVSDPDFVNSFDQQRLGGLAQSNSAVGVGKQEFEGSSN